MTRITTLLLTALIVLAPSGRARAQTAADPNVVVDPTVFETLEYRSLGFTRGGRSTAVTGVPSQPLVYYLGSTGGGVFKTVDAGISWNSVTDGQLGVGSIGAIAVADSDPNVVYVGTGSACPRGNISPGDGVYRSLDAGKTWAHIGLREAGQIGRIRVHPRDHNLPYVAVVGNLFGDNEERGLFRSKNGGETWEKVLYISDTTGVVDVSLDPTNPRILYAGAWAVRRTPWTIDSGSTDGGLYKSSDGGDTWARVEGGLPNDGPVGKVSVSISPANPNRIWALVEAEGDDGGLYRSDDGGDTWDRINRERRFLQRAWYYIHVIADPVDEETVYVLNTGFYRSTDGGEDFDQVRVPHGDNHDLWINPNDNTVMINANDGGANVSFTGGTSWSTQQNQPTAEFYRVTVDNQYPYRVCGAQQDNSTASVPSRGNGMDFFTVGGGESGHIAVNLEDPRLVYAGSYGGTITEMDVQTRLSNSIQVYPESQTGQRAADMRYRFQWNAPIPLSPHDASILYMTSQHVHRTTDAGHTWEVISPDLTRNDRSKQDYAGGGGITRDNTGTEVYGVVFAFEESPDTPGLLWAGTDDGRVHLSHDAGATWSEITPAGIPEWGVVNMIDLSAHDPGRAHIAVYKYRQNDDSPYIFQTSDYGRTWRRLTDGTNGIPADHWVRVVREDPDQRGLLYAGTEFGLWVSFDDGVHWQTLQLNLPATPITDLAIHRKDLVVATQGRAFWMLDDLHLLHQIESLTANERHLFTPDDAFRGTLGPAAIHYLLPEAHEGDVTIEILDGGGRVVATFTGTASEDDDTDDVPMESGLNRFVWNGRYERDFEAPEGTIMWGGRGTAGPAVVPGEYNVRVSTGDWNDTREFQIQPDPRVETSGEEYREQLSLARRVGARTRELYDNLGALREIKAQAAEIGERMRKAGHGDDVADAASALSERLTAIEGNLTQLEGEGGQDALNFPGQLDNQFAVLYDFVIRGDRLPPRASYDRLEDLEPQLDALIEELNDVLGGGSRGLQRPRPEHWRTTRGSQPTVAERDPIEHGSGHVMPRRLSSPPVTTRPAPPPTAAPRRRTTTLPARWRTRVGLGRASPSAAGRARAARGTATVSPLPAFTRVSYFY